MGIHVNIAKAKAQLSELVASALRGEEVILDRAGKPQVKLVPCEEAFTEEQLRIAAKRRAAFGVWKDRVGGRQIDVPDSMTDEELEERWQRKFGPAA